MAAKHSNFHLITNYSVKQWITVSDTLFSWMSTSIAEIYFANKSCFVVRPFPIEWEYDPVIYENCKGEEKEKQAPRETEDGQTDGRCVRRGFHAMSTK